MLPRRSSAVASRRVDACEGQQGLTTVAYREPEFLPWDGRRVPLTFVGGYLGAGKTTVINDVLATTDRPIAVIVNDVGAINIDAKLIRKRHGDTIELTNGCICCGSIEEMGAAFDRIRARPNPPDHVIVELSGVADPQRMIPWGQSAGFMLDGVVVVVAADQLLDGALPEFITTQLHSQIRDADLLILTKTDLADAEAVRSANARLAELAPYTPVFLGGPDHVGQGAVGQFLALGGRGPRGPIDVATPTLFDAHETRTVKVPWGITSTDLSVWVQHLQDHLADRIVRAKGFVNTVDHGLLMVQVVGSRCEISEVPRPELQEPTDLVVITLREGFVASPAVA